MRPAAAGPNALSSSLWLNALVANIQDAIVLLDRDGHVHFESPAARRMLGSDPVARQGVFRLERIHPEERDAVIRSFQNTLDRPGSSARATYRFRRADGAWKHLEAVAKNLVDDPALQGILITFRDVSERVEALEEAERAGRARDEFLSRMSHELRTPLHAVLGWAQLLEAVEDPHVRRAGEQIAGAGHHLLRLVEEALDLAAIREGRVALDVDRVAVHAIVAEAVELISPLASERDVELRIDRGCPGHTWVWADRVRLRQVMINLLANAVKYNRYAGDVIVWWRGAGDGWVRISVRDTGPGMPAEKLHHVFESFERLGMEALGIEGNGLGLSISRRLVDMMKGRIGVESRVGDGALFYVELPGEVGAPTDPCDRPVRSSA